MTFPDLLEVIEHGEELSQRWPDFVHEFDYPMENCWYFFERDENTGLNTMTPVSREASSSAGIGYSTFRMLHHLAFTREGVLFWPMRALAKMVDGSLLESAYTKSEQIIKGLTNECRHCGDCAMLDLAYLCPMSQCPKNQRNGPCGGSYEGWCEAYPNQRKCIYVLAYDRLKAHGADQSLGENPVPPVNYALNETSSWINFYLGRDHSAPKLKIETVARKKKSK
jgi:methylenetetrahydrofolate reductase (NADPH)